MPWSYRIDVFLLLVVGYAIIASVAALLVAQANFASLREIRKSPQVGFFVTHRPAIMSLVRGNSYDRDAKSDSANPIPFDKVKAFVDEAKTNSAVLAQIERSRTELSKRLELLDPNSDRLMAVISLKLVADQLNGLALVGDLAGAMAPLIVLFTILIAAYFAFQIQSVFFTPQLIVVYKHPEFPILFIQFAFIMVTPFFLISCVEATYWTEYSELVRSLFSGLEINTWSTASNDYLRLRSTRSTGLLGQLADRPNRNLALNYPRPFRLTLIAFLLPIGSVMSSAIWLTRRFGWATFFGGLVCCSVVFILLTLLEVSTSMLSINLAPSTELLALGGPFFIAGGMNEIMGVFVASELVFIFAVIAGLYLTPVRSKKYIVSTGYMGLLFSTTFTVAFFLGYLNDNPLLAALLLLSITVAFVACVEFCIRLLTQGFLINPQP